MNTQLDFAAIKSQANFESIVVQALDSRTMRRNGNEIRANCPFKVHEKPNGFSANITKGVWQCFSCNESGDLIKFIKNINKLSTKKAAEFIQEQSGNSTIIYQPTQEKSYTDQAVIDAWNNASSQGNDTYFLHRNLTPPPSAKFGKNPKKFYSTLMPFQDIQGNFKGILSLKAQDKYNYFIEDDTTKFMLLGELQEIGDLFIGEGIATVQTVWEAFNRKIPAIAVGGWVNMIPVLHELTTTYPKLKIIILLDLDKKDKIESIHTLYPDAICVLPQFQSNKMNHKDFNDIISKEHQPLTEVYEQVANGIIQAQSTTIKPAVEVELFEQQTLTAQEKSKDPTSLLNSNLMHLITPNSEEKLIADIKSVSKGISTGYTIGDIDLIFPGGAISVIAAPTSHGKTTALINFCLGTINENHEKNAYFFSYEESEASILTSFINTYISKGYNEIDVVKQLSKNNKRSIESYFRGETKFITKNLESSFTAAKDFFFKEVIDTKKLKVIYSDMSIEELVQSIVFIKNNDQKVGIIYIDYIQLLRLSKSKLGRQEEVKEICIQLKNCAIKTGLPIVIAAQFNRTVQTEADMSVVNIGEAGDIERIASLIVGMFNRNFVMHKDGNKDRQGNEIKPENTIYFEILKGRNVGVGHKIIMEFNGNAGTLNNVQDNTQPTQINEYSATSTIQPFLKRQFKTTFRAKNEY